MIQPGDEDPAREAAEDQEAPLKVVLEHEQRLVLEDVARAMVLPYRDVIRARTILMLADGSRGPR